MIIIVIIIIIIKVKIDRPSVNDCSTGLGSDKVITVVARRLCGVNPMAELRALMPPADIPKDLFR